MAQVATRKYAELVDETSDLGVLYQMNSRALLGFDLARQWMRNVVAFQEGNRMCKRFHLIGCTRKR